MNKRVLEVKNVDTSGNCVLYVMSRDQRVNDNHALLFAQEIALEKQLPLHVLFNVLPKVGFRSKEHFEFMINGLKVVEQDLRNLNIQFHVSLGTALDEIIASCKSLKPSDVIFDFSPLKGPRQLQKSIAKYLDANVYVVDTHNIIPLWVLSDKEEFAAHTIRSKVHKHLADWLIVPEPMQKHSVSPDPFQPVDWTEVEECIEKQPTRGLELNLASGEPAALQVLDSFLNNITTYAAERNDPTQNAQSGLSPYLHFGQISSLRVALQVAECMSDIPLLLKEAKLASYDDAPSLDDSANAFLEELIVRKELADNYCFYNRHYTSLRGARKWAQETLHSHESDPRERIYDLETFEQATTHDDAWNAAQNQLMITGKMHGYMRMYWAKKILEWSPTPEDAIRIAIYLNDAYSIDGGDPNGYTGIMWSIAGVHDRPWFEREVFGKIRFMNRSGLQRKFDLQAYIETWQK